PAPGATWHYLLTEGGSSSPPDGVNHITKYERDSVYQGIHTKVLTGTSFFAKNNCSNWNDTILTYTSNDSVFVHGSQTVHNWELLYSFNTPVGQSWKLMIKDNTAGTLIIDTITVKVDSVKNTLINSVSLKTLYVTYTVLNGIIPQTYHSVIYDRIGDPKGAFDYISRATVLSGPCYTTILLCYSDSLMGTYQVDTSKSCTYSFSGINQLSNNNAIKIYPNPANNKITIDATDIVDVKLFDVLGKQIISKIG